MKNQFVENGYKKEASIYDKDVCIFLFLWALIFILYLPAAKAGFVSDFTGWLDQIKNHGFGEYINRSNFGVKSLYQFTQFATWLFYKCWGANAWAWHTLFVSMHAVNGYLLYRLCKHIFNDAGIKNGGEIALCGVILFCVSPYMSEVIVWEPSYHYLQGLLFILLILLCVQQYFYSQHSKYVLCAAILYFLSTYTLEVFYMTPALVLSLLCYYRWGLAYDKKTFYKALKYFFLTEVCLFLLRFLTFRLLYGSWVSRVGVVDIAALSTDFEKPAKYVLKLFFLLRFFPFEIKRKIYNFCDATKGINLFYILLLFICTFIVVRFRKLGGRGKTMSLLFVWLLLSLAIILPMWFDDSMLVIYDRYTYFTAAFLYMMVAVAISYIPNKYVRITVFVIYAVINTWFTIKVNRLWGKSEYVISGLLRGFPKVEPNKTVILLNLPETMKGVPMIGSTKEGEYKLMHNLLLPHDKISNTVYDAISYNMITPADGVHVTVLNDSTIRTTLNQDGEWWWYEGKGGGSYKNKDYNLNVNDGGGYEMVLHNAAAQYLLLYQTGDRWKVVDWSKKNQDQY